MEEDFPIARAFIYLSIMLGDDEAENYCVFRVMLKYR
jgi:hypothetical protein